MWTYYLLHYFFLLFHTGLILFNCLGWIWRKTRRWNLYTLLATGCSWFVLGIFYGWGYCPCTDWHWQVLYELGANDLPRSYIAYLVELWMGLTLDPMTVDVATLGVFILALIISAITNYRSRSF